MAVEGRSGDAARRTICVLGAGAAGLVFAREVERSGHRAIVLEASSTVGGPCTSEVIDGRAHDLCGRLCGNGYRQIGALIGEFGLTTQPASQAFLFHPDSRSVSRVAAVEFGAHRELLATYLELRRRQVPRIDEPGLAHSDALSVPARTWLAEHGLEPLLDSLGACFTAAGFGDVDDDLPALYFAKTTAYFFNGRKTHVLGHNGPFTVVGGFHQLWDRLAAQLSDVRCGVEVTSIARSGPHVTVHTTAGTVTADALVLTIPWDAALPLLADATDDERDIARRIRRIDYYTTLCRISGAPTSGMYILTNDRRATHPGRLVALHNQHADTDWYVCYSYGGGELTAESALEQLHTEVEKIGGRIREVRLQRRWSRMPHFSGAAIADGVYRRIEANQGKHRTYVIGSLPAFELNECNVSYAQDAARRFFPPHR
ncbi:flavin monoamine oxidase family protein [Streptomyces sp. HD]|uniref:flavin monoamine oxidase family protein n=1 Tax=Streptomyces sp. HD TaxID=3020892 RepID=UPI00232B1BA1|nr:FAD-dependent oxidoreductase [Streptomyces sp. HD]MDC0770736.1 FAD-dependent oxidoreductase [Streptomyces sp. HD]